MLIDKQNISKFIPQAQPMIMIDCLLENDEKKTITSLSISSENIFCAKGVFREAGLIENMAQTAAVRSGYIAKQNNESVRTGFIGAIKNLRIEKLPACESTIITELTTDYEFDNFSMVSAKIFLDDKIIASCEMKIVLL